MTTKNRSDHWARWVRYVKPLGLDPYLQDTPFQLKLRALTGFAARARTGTFGARQTVKTCTVTGYLASVGQTIALACGTNPLKILGSDKYLPRLQISLDGWKQVDPTIYQKSPSGIRYTRTAGTVRHIVQLDKRLSHWGSHHYCFLLSITGGRIHYQEYTGKHETNCPVQNGRHHIL